jgi:hypothetical protein
VPTPTGDRDLVLQVDLRPAAMHLIQVLSGQASAEALAALTSHSISRAGRSQSLMPSKLGGDGVLQEGARRSAVCSRPAARSPASQPA